MPEPRIPASPAALTPPDRDGGISVGDRVDMQSAADFLMADMDTVVDLLTRAGVPLVREGEVVSVARHDLEAYRDRERAARRAGLREITRLSIAAGLDDLDYASLYEDRP